MVSILKILIASLLLATSPLLANDFAQTQIELRANVLPLNFLIVEADNIDFGDLQKGSKIQGLSEIRVFGRKDLDVKVEVEEVINLKSKLDNTKSLVATMLNHNIVTGDTHKLNQSIVDDEGQVSIPVEYELNVSADAKTGEHYGMSVIRVTIDS